MCEGGGSAAATPGILNQKSEQSSDLSSSAADAAPAIIEQVQLHYLFLPSPLSLYLLSSLSPHLQTLAICLLYGGWIFPLQEWDAGRYLTLSSSQKSPSYPWPPLHHHQQRSWTGEKATCQPPIGHQRPALANYDCAAAYAVTLGEKPMALELELFPLGGDSDAIDSSRDRRASVSSHVKFYQFL